MLAALPKLLAVVGALILVCPGARADIVHDQLRDEVAKVRHENAKVRDEVAHLKGELAWKTPQTEGDPLPVSNNASSKPIFKRKPHNDNFPGEFHAGQLRQIAAFVRNHTSGRRALQGESTCSNAAEEGAVPDYVGERICMKLFPIFAETLDGYCDRWMCESRPSCPTVSSNSA